MSFKKADTVITMIKKVTVVSKPIFKSGVCIFKTKSGKKMTVPEDNVLVSTPKFVMYELATRKLFKGEFEITKGFMVDDENNVRISTKVLTLAEEPPKKNSKQKKADEKRIEAMQKARSKKGKVKKKKRK